MISGVIRFCLENKLVVIMTLVVVAVGGAIVAPFDWDLGGIVRYPVPVDAIPDIGENQQIVFTEWMGRSPQDIEDQITYPLTVALLGLPGVKTVRSSSMFGFSSIYIIFEERIDFYWSRSRVLEKLASLPAGTLPDGVQPVLGPDATGLGQVFWYTLEPLDEHGDPVGGLWDLEELRGIQDFYIRPALLAAGGVSDVASIGGFVREYQIDVDPDAMRAHGVTLEQVFRAVKMSNLDVGARTIEINRVEYVIRSLGFIQSLDDLEQVVVRVDENVPIQIRHIGRVALGPALRRGALDKGGAEAVGGVVIARYGANPLQVIKNVKKEIARISPWGEPRIGDDGREGRVHIVPFYDRAELIRETLETLRVALVEEILVTILVVIFMVMHLRSALLISGLLPLAVLMCFLAMKAFGVDANIVALSGIAIAIGTMVDMGVVVCENILKHLDEASPDEPRLEVVHRAASEVGSAVVTAILTTVVSFLPVFLMEGAEGKLFRPLAFTKTFALLASVVVAITVIPPMAHLLIARPRIAKDRRRDVLRGAAIAGGLVIAAAVQLHTGLAVAAWGLVTLLAPRTPERLKLWLSRLACVVAMGIVAVLLARHWSPIGHDHGELVNLLFVVVVLGGLLAFFWILEKCYETILRGCLRFKALFLLVPASLVAFGLVIWLGFAAVFGWVPGALDRVGLDGDRLRASGPWVDATHRFTGLGKEFMPALDEGLFLLMPTTMTHASIGEAFDVLQTQDIAISSIPEVDEVVGKIGRAETAIDPAPISMIETVITYHPEYVTDDDGRRSRFRYDEGRGEFVRDERGLLVADEEGRYFRQWRDHIRTPDDIWNEIIEAAEIPGTTSAPKLQPIETRIVMLQSGMRAPMGIKVSGPDLASIERFGLELEARLKELDEFVKPATVYADRVVGKPYLEIEIDREAIARYGVHVKAVQDVVEVAVGGRRLTTTVEGRERYPVRVRYLRELRDSLESLRRIQVAGAGGVQVPLEQLAEMRYVRGPQVIKSEDTFLTSYVLFDRQPDHAEVDVVEECDRYLKSLTAARELVKPEGIEYRFAGSYENQLRAAKKLALILPLALFVIFVILYLQFRSASTSTIVFSGIAVAWAGGFLFLWLYAQPWFLDFEVSGQNLRDLFQVHPINLSVAVWVGFLALFGIATDDGVVIATYLKQSFDRTSPGNIQEIREATVLAGKRRCRPCLMTVATTMLALLPVLTSTGRGADIMVPMAIPSFGGMAVVPITMFVVPTVYCAIEEWRHRLAR